MPPRTVNDKVVELRNDMAVMEKRLIDVETQALINTTLFKDKLDYIIVKIDDVPTKAQLLAVEKKVDDMPDSAKLNMAMKIVFGASSMILVAVFIAIVNMVVEKV
jgi:hypothetical protein